ncbi:MAG: CDP-2,3-bis-(O-geranylgeranyl)-sn-glycerol synthase [Candidatus Undinarchaeales archaeon]
MENIAQLILTSMIWVLPAYVANASPVIFGGGKPLDFGKKFIDGKRILGNGKTIKGFIAGIFAGSFIGFVEGILLIGFLLALGAILGDLAGSFIKRRVGIKRGQPFWVLDQFDFVIGALLLVSLIELPALEVIIAVLLITPALHLLTNFIAYKLDMKKVPW